MPFNSTVEKKNTFRIKPIEDGTSVRVGNALVVLQLLRQRDRLSRSELAQITGVAPSTMGSLIHDLSEVGFIFEEKLETSKRGRPKTLIGLNPSYGHIIGFELGASHVTAVVVDFTGRVLATKDAHLNVEDEPKETLQCLEHIVNVFLAELNSTDSKFLGIGLAIPSPYAADSSSEMNTGLYPAWTDFSLTEFLTRKYDVPVILENDANTGALAEAWWGPHPHVSTMAYIKVATGVGAGLILNGELHRGVSGMAGEIGHTVTDGNQSVCRCGLTGCLETQIGRTSLINTLQAQGITVSTLDEIILLAQNGSTAAREVIEDAARSLGIAIANLINLYGPEVVILGGSLTRAKAILIPKIEEILNSRTFGLRTCSPNIQVSELGSHAIARGSTTLVFEKAFRTSMMFTEPDPAFTPFFRSTHSSISHRRHL